MTKLAIAALALLLGCRGHSDRPADKPPVQLPVPHKLPPAGSAAAAGSGEDHAKAIDDEYATVLAMYNAPAGATPCESLHNAVLAEADAAKKLGRASVFSFVAPEPEFLKVCSALPQMVQQCLVPKYQATHAQECDGVQPDDAAVGKLYKLRSDLEPPKEPGQMPPSPGP
jgi:hypothetical protein